MNVSALTAWDYFVMATLAISVALGAMRGLVRTVFALAAWVVAIFGVGSATQALIDFTGWTLPPLFVGALVFFVLLVAVRLIGSTVARTLSRIGLGAADRTLGSALGVVRAVLVIAVVTIAGHQLGAHRDASWQHALTRPLLDTLVSWVEPWLPTRSGPQPPLRTT